MRNTAHTVEPGTGITYEEKQNKKTVNSEMISRPSKPIEPNRNMSKQHVHELDEKSNEEKNGAFGKAKSSDIAYAEAQDSGNDVGDEKTNRDRAESNTSDPWIRSGNRGVGSLG